MLGVLRLKQDCTDEPMQLTEGPRVFQNHKAQSTLPQQTEIKAAADLLS